MSDWLNETLPPELVDSTLFRFQVILANGTIVPVDMTKDLDVDQDRLLDQYQNVVQQYAYWAAVYSEVRSTVASLERRTKVRRGVVADEAIQAASAVKVKLTDTQVKTIIEADETLNQLEELVIKAHKHAGKLYHMTEALKMKFELMRSLVSLRRKENDLS